MQCVASHPEAEGSTQDSQMPMVEKEWQKSEGPWKLY